MITLVIGAARDLQVNRLVVPRGFGDQLFNDRLPASDIQRVRQLDAGQCGGQSRQVFVDAEGAPRVDRNQLINPVAVEKPPVERRDACLGERQELAVQVNRIGDVGGHGLS